jgi:hypothetical protein
VKDKNQEMEWVDITPKHGIWNPTQTGETITGTLLSATPAPYKGRSNTKYCLQTDHPEAINQKIIIYGTTCLNKALKNPELIGKTIKITYKGEIKNNNDPVKKPFKKYKIKVQVRPTDPLYSQKNIKQEIPSSLTKKVDLERELIETEIKKLKETNPTLADVIDVVYAENIPITLKNIADELQEMEESR